MMDKKSEQWERFQFTCETLRFIEESPNTYALRGHLDGHVMEQGYIEVDGYKYKEVPREIGNARLYLDDIDYVNKKYTKKQYGFSIDDMVAEIPPFGVVKFNYIDLDWGWGRHISCIRIYRKNGEKVETDADSSNLAANLFIMACNILGKSAYFARGSKCDIGHDTVFHFPILWGGGGYKVFVEFCFNELLEMDCTMFTKFYMDELRRFCESIPILKESLNFEIFKRRLTDMEKLECAHTFIDIYKKHLEKPFSKTRINMRTIFY